MHSCCSQAEHTFSLSIQTSFACVVHIACFLHTLDNDNKAINCFKIIIIGILLTSAGYEIGVLLLETELCRTFAL